MSSRSLGCLSKLTEMHFLTTSGWNSRHWSSSIDLVRIARIEIFLQALLQLEFEFRQGQHGTKNLLSLRLVKSQSDWIFMTSQDVRRFLLVVERIPFVQGIVGLKSDKLIVLPLPLAVTSLLLGT